ncbi:MAG: DNA-directed RNA polymerase subunit alpha [Clostridia bacterium]|nr:DNA-directed RNA polymerase subunit alpha [Clostridia bacterium]
MMEIETPKITVEENENGSKMNIVVEPLERGFGITLGNAMRRVLLSSLPGAAIVGIKIDGVQHEFSTIEGVTEDVAEIILNLKNVTLKTMKDDDSFRKTIALNKVGPCEVYAGDITTDAEVEVLNPDLYLCTIAEGGSIDCELTVGRGRGYVSAEKNKEVNKELKLNYPIGYIPIDSIYSPVKKVNYNVEAARVGQSIGFDKLTMEVETNGAFTGREIVSLAGKILSEHIQMFVKLSELGDRDYMVNRQEDQQQLILEKSVDDMDLSVRSWNCLKRANIQTIGDLTRRTMEDMLKVRNLGKKSLDEIIARLETFGLGLKIKED